MEQQPTRGESGSAGGWEAYDAVPRDGPWLFVAVAEAWDRGEIRGAWVRASASSEEVVTVLLAATGHPVTVQELTIVDQVGIDQPIAEIWSGAGGR